MTAPLRFTRAELENAARICREHEVAVRLGRDGSVIVFPAPPVAPLDLSTGDEIDAEIAAFEAKHGGGRT